MPQAPAGWYRLPNGMNQYWNGSNWVPTPPPTPTSVPMSIPTPSTSATTSAQAPRATGLSARLSGMSVVTVVALAALVGVPASFASAVAATGAGLAFAPSSESGTITRIVDGDTFDVSVEGETKRVRLLNVDTPESVKPGVEVQCLSLEATAALTEMIPVGSTVTLGFDTSRFDQYGRTLAGVTSAQGLLVNAELARLGLGLPVVVGNNRKYEPPVTKASAEAQQAERGLFSPDSSCAVAADAQKVEDAARALESAPAPTTPAEADTLLEQAAALAVLATALDTRLKATDAFEVVTLPASVLKRYVGIAAAATSRANVVHAAATAKNTEFQRVAQEKAAEAAAQAKAAADAKAKADADAKAQAAADAQAKALAAAQAKAAADAKATALAAQARAQADAKAKAKATADAKAAAAAKAKRQTLLAAPQKKTTSSGSGSGSGSTSGSTSTGGCVIKGNISSSGERIFHVPGGGSYNVTKIDLSKGERWFCSESAAVNAGWRKARN